MNRAMLNSRTYFIVAGSLLFGAATLGAPCSAAAQAPAEKAAASATLKPIDDDGDGKVTRAEWSRFVQGFTRYDVDKDAAVSLAELQAAAETQDVPLILQPADANRDGKLTRPEWSRMAQ